MKTFILALLLVFSTIAANSQAWTWFDLDDEIWGGLNQIYIDTLNENNVWQIGKPNKTIFKEASTLPNAIVTDTVRFYPINDTSIFYLTHYRVTYDITYILQLTFDYQLNSDTITDFGLIEASFDGGINWINLIEDYQDYEFSWSNGPPSFSGNTNGWRQTGINILSALDYFPENDSIIYKFTFITDSIQTNKDGWMMDNFGLFDWWETIEEIDKSLSIVYPNPATDLLFIKFNNPTKELCSIELFNSTGQKIRILDTKEDLIKFNIKDYAKGFYTYLIYFNDGRSFIQGKFIKR